MSYAWKGKDAITIHNIHGTRNSYPSGHLNSKAGCGNGGGQRSVTITDNKGTGRLLMADTPDLKVAIMAIKPPPIKIWGTAVDSIPGWTVPSTTDAAAGILPHFVLTDGEGPGCILAKKIFNHTVEYIAMTANI